MKLILMLKESKDLRIVFSMFLLAIAFYILSNVTGDRSADCAEKGGTWLKKYKECENINLINCLEISGFYNFCASPCRHNEEENIAETCTLPCTKVCGFIHLKK